MTSHDLAPQPIHFDGPQPARLSGTLVWYVLLEACTWLFLIGAVSTVSAGAWGSSAFTLAVALAGIAVSFVRRSGARRLTLFTTLVELLTLFVVIGVVSNPARNGLPVVVGALLAWIVVETARALLWQPATVVGAVGQVALLVGVAAFVDGRSAQTPLLAVLPAWAVLELIWAGIARRLAARSPLNYRLSRRQKIVVIAASVALVIALIVSAIFNYTTARYYGETVSMDALRDKWTSLYCITYPWKFAGVNLSGIGFGGTTECFDTEAELRQAAATHEWVARRGFSDEVPSPPAPTRPPATAEQRTLGALRPQGEG